MADNNPILDGTRFEFANSGLNPDVDTGSVPEDIWPVGGKYPFLSAAAAGTIVSTSAADTATGGGAQTVRIQGLDANFNELTEDVTLNGITPVALANNYFRINSAFVIKAGAQESNAGDIDITVGGQILARISIGFGTSRNAIYTVPNTVSRVRVFRWWASIGRQAATQASLELLARVDGVVRDVLTIDLNTQGTGYVDHNIPSRNTIEPGTDVWARCILCTTNNTAIASGFDLVQG